MPGLDDYASPILRCAVFRQLNPGCQISYTVVPIGTAFPLGHTQYEGKATEAVKCEIVLQDGSYITAFKEIDKVDRGRDIPATPENMAKNETKALGRALRDGGIPQRLSELRDLMVWVSTLDGSGNGKASSTSLPFDAEDVSVEEVDDADAGAQEPTPEQLVAQKFAQLNGADKAAVVKHAREVLNLGNVMRSGEQAETLMAYIEGQMWRRGDAPTAAPPELPTLEEEEESF